MEAVEQPGKGREVMLYIYKGKRKGMLVLGFLGMALFACGDVLLQSFSNDGTAILLMLNTAIRDMPMGRLYVTLLTGIIATPWMYLGLCGMDSCLRNTLGNAKGKMYRCFQIGALMAALSFFAAHSVCTVLEMSIKQALVSGASPETIEGLYRAPFLLSFVATNLWVTISEGCLSVAYIYYVLKKVFSLPRVAILLNTAGITILFHIAGGLLSRITGNALFSLLAKAGPSLGMGMMFLAVAQCADRN